MTVYNNIFSYGTIEQNLKLLKSLVGDGILIDIPFYVYNKTITHTPKDNSKFMKLLKHSVKTSNKVYFMVYAEIVPNSFLHSTACSIIDNVIHLYDSSGENGSMYFVKGLYANMDGVSFHDQAYNPCSNMIYQIVSKMLYKQFPKHIYRAHSDFTLTPTYCHNSSSGGMCALWALIYILLRSYNKGETESVHIIFNISKEALSHVDSFDIIFYLHSILDIEQASQFENEASLQNLEIKKRKIIEKFMNQLTIQ